MFTSVRPFGSVRSLVLLSLSLTAIVPALQAQTAPQLLPYTAKVVAGGGSTATKAGSACAGPTGVSPSGNTSVDAYGDGCLATEIPASELAGSKPTYGPKSVVTDSTGAIYFADSNNYLVRRIDPTTGVVTNIAGGASKNPASGAACGSTTLTDTAHTVTTGDAFADGCVGTEIKFGSVVALVFLNGDLYIADEYNYNVRKMSFTNGGVAGVVLTSGGSNYANAPTVTFSAPASGTAATGTATITGGVVTSIAITNPGSGYSASAMPTITFSGSGAGAAGTAVYTGVMSTAVGSANGTSTTAKGFISATAGSTAPTCNVSNSATPCVLDEPYGLAADTLGDLFIADNYYQAVVVLNTNATGSTTVANQTIPAQTVVRITGSRASSAPCSSGSASPTAATPSGCSGGTYTGGVSATTQELYYPYGLALDSSGNVYIADEDENSVALVTNSSGYLTNFAGAMPQSTTGVIEPVTERALAGTFGIGTNFDVAVDTMNNVYVPDALAGYVWRVDATTNSMYLLGGGGAATTAGTACSASGIGSSFTATDAYGDGCPALLANFSKSGTAFATTGVWGVWPDKNSNVFVADEGDGLVREIASGTQFGNTGASSTDYVEVHFANGDTPLKASGTNVPFAVTPTSLFSLATPSCTANSDGTTDCVIAVTATPTVSGAYTGTLTVKSTSVTAGTPFTLSGNFTQNPNARLSLTFADSTLSCGSMTPSAFLNSDAIALTGTLILSGPVPTGTITFFEATNGGMPVQIGTPQNVINMGTASLPVYGATLNHAFSVTGNYTITVNYNSNGGYYNPATGTGTLTSATPTFALAPITTMQSTVTAGQTALYSFASSPTVYTGTITYSVSGLPANASAVFSPSSVTATGCSQTSTIALSVLTTATTPTVPAGLTSGRGPWAWMSFAAALGLAMLIGLRRRGSRLGQMMMAVLLLVTMTGLVACNGTHVNAPPATPTGTYTLTVTGTGSTGVVSSTTLPLVVR